MKILCPWIVANLAEESIDNTKNHWCWKARMLRTEVGGEQKVSHPCFFWNWLLLDGHGLFKDSELDHLCVQAPL